MKKLLFLLFALAIVTDLSAQSRATTTSPLHYYSPMWNIQSVYYNTVTTSNAGNQIDTVRGSNSVFLSTSRWGQGTVNNDTFTLAPVSGSANVTIDVTVFKAAVVSTVVPTVTVNLQSSPNGIDWSPVAGVNSFTLAPSSTTTPAAGQFNFTKVHDFYRVWYQGADTTSIRARWFSRVPFTMMRSN